ncbi:MAG: hypothetical protein MUO76_20855 [Anaerolineaceae bacterium]|nr:hypothetical protein [Anaerolineaceae bacterium]
MTKQVLPLGEEHYYDLNSFFVSSAYLMYMGEQEEDLYPSFRLMDAAKRLTEYIISSGGFKSESWPQSFLEKCEQGIALSSDKDAFIEFLNDSTRMLANEMKNRAEREE